MIRYKANECGVAVITTEERYTSGASFIDDELPVKEIYKKYLAKELKDFAEGTGFEIEFP